MIDDILPLAKSASDYIDSGKYNQFHINNLLDFMELWKESDKYLNDNYGLSKANHGLCFLFSRYNKILYGNSDFSLDCSSLLDKILQDNYGTAGYPFSSTQDGENGWAINYDKNPMRIAFVNLICETFD